MVVYANLLSYSLGARQLALLLTRILVAINRQIMWIGAEAPSHMVFSTMRKLRSKVRALVGIMP